MQVEIFLNTGFCSVISVLKVSNIRCYMGVTTGDAYLEFIADSVRHYANYGKNIKERDNEYNRLKGIFYPDLIAENPTRSSTNQWRREGIWKRIWNAMKIFQA